MEVAEDEAEMQIRIVIQEVVLTHHRRYGYRRVTADVRSRGHVVNLGGGDRPVFPQSNRLGSGQNARGQGRHHSA